MHGRQRRLLPAQSSRAFGSGAVTRPVFLKRGGSLTGLSPLSKEDRVKSSRGFVSLMGLAAMLAAVLLTSPSRLMGQKREDFIALQRDVAQLQDQLKQMQTDQDQKLTALQTLIQQALEASGKLSAGLGSLQDNLRSGMSEQQQRTAAPLATMNNKLNQ